jgi:hypothetical protein
MDTIREYTKNPLVTGIAGLVVGIVFGLVVLGWGIWPVRWTNATPEHLGQAWKTEVMRMSIQAYGQDGDATKAQERYAAVGKDAEQVLNEISQDPQGLSDTLISDFRTLVGGEVPVTTPPAAEEEPRSVLPVLLGALCVLLLVLVAFLAYMFVFRKRMTPGGQPSPAVQAQEIRRQAGYTDYAATGEEAPIAQFMASYKLGDDLFDDSFSIDSASGEFLGECGVGISETIGVGDHKKVTTFEVWLFDKNDIQTITKVMMSSHAFNDSAIRQRLEAKGEPVLLEPGIETVLETQTLQLVARVMDMGYGDGSMPEESFFEHMLLELAVWAKQ